MGAGGRVIFTRELSNLYLFIAARIELGYWFGLARAEALLVEMEEADQGHCLEVDIRVEHPRSRRRLIQIETGEQRQALDRINRLLDTADDESSGPEGNYQQRLYRFRSLIKSRTLQGTA